MEPDPDVERFLQNAITSRVSPGYGGLRGSYCTFSVLVVAAMSIPWTGIRYQVNDTSLVLVDVFIRNYTGRRQALSSPCKCRGAQRNFLDT